MSISIDKNWSDAQQTLGRQKLSTHVLSVLDSSGSVPDQYGTYQYPETYLLSPDLRILFKWIGPQDWGGPEIRARMKELLSQSISGARVKR